MGLLNKLGIGTGSGASRNVSRQTPSANAGGHQRAAGTPPIAVGPQRSAAAVPETNRVSNGLKEFLWNLDGLGRGTLLDLGPAWQTTLNFFIERGFRVTSDDLLHSWKNFLAEEEKRLQKAATSTEAIDLTPTGRAARFVQANLQYSPSSFTVSGSIFSASIGAASVAAPLRAYAVDVPHLPSTRDDRALSRSEC